MDNLESVWILDYDVQLQTETPGGTHGEGTTDGDSCLCWNNDDSDASNFIIMYIFKVLN